MSAATWISRSRSSSTSSLETSARPASISRCRRAASSVPDSMTRGMLLRVSTEPDGWPDPMAARPAGATVHGMTSTVHPAPLRVLVTGGGVAGMEAILALDELAGARVQITLLAPESTFACRPMAVAVPFARGRVQRLELAAFARETGTLLVRGSLDSVEPGLARTSAGAVLPYDALLVAVGAWSEPAVRGATTWTQQLDQGSWAGCSPTSSRVTPSASPSWCPRERPGRSPPTSSRS